MDDPLYTSYLIMKKMKTNHILNDYDTYTSERYEFFYCKYCFKLVKLSSLEYKKHVETLTHKSNINLSKFFNYLIL